ncbi:hypothetical protein [Chroococcidiopsis sp. TS-821]|uniref:hypothetical protein n=1 Tax=Chroococcidiopsis sp. TS-821 TaxID=1378066 RepID=UPI000CEF2710|nr:hypothetical protein [Chroococcidiopsis sp. TS-821]PPS39919.1 hypothetical protein B1A85_21060 [Chroococcidiopsis sp. TS-821]
MQLVDFLLAIDGRSSLYAPDGEFLGLVSSDFDHPLSICNSQGLHGSNYGLASIRNPHSMYGGTHGLHSPYNPYSIEPPVIIYQNESVLQVTTNNYLNSDLPIVEPDVLLGVLIIYGAERAIQNRVISNYERARRSNAQFISSIINVGYT